MPDDELNSIVREMMDAGESDEAIDSFINEYDTAASNVDRGGDIRPDFTSQVIGEVGPEEPDTYWGGFFNSLNPFGGGEALTAGLQGAKGYAKGAVTDIPESLYGMAANTASFAGDVLSDPVGYGGKVSGALGDLPAVARGVGIGARNVGSSIMQAGSQPEEFGRMTGQLMGQPAVMGGLSPHIPAAVRTAGTPVAGAGRIMRQHQPLSGAIPRMVEPRIARTIERGVGGLIEAGGNRMKGYGITPPSQVPPPVIPQPPQPPPLGGPTTTGFNPPPRTPPRPTIPPSRQLPPSNTSFYQGPGGGPNPTSGGSGGGTTTTPPRPTSNTSTPPNPVSASPFVDDVLGPDLTPMPEMGPSAYAGPERRITNRGPSKNAVERRAGEEALLRPSDRTIGNARQDELLSQLGGQQGKSPNPFTPEALAEIKKRRSEAMDASSKGYKGTIDESGNITPKKNVNVVEKIKNLVKDESGTFDLDEARSVIDRMSPTQILESIRRYSNRAQFGRTYDDLIEYAATRLPQNRGPLPDDVRSVLDDIEAARSSRQIPERMPVTPEEIADDAAAIRQTENDVPASYRDMFARMGDDDVEAFIRRYENAEGYQGPVGQNIIQHAYDVLNRRTNQLTETLTPIMENIEARIPRREYTPEEVNRLQSNEAVDLESGLTSTYAPGERVNVTEPIMDALDRIPEEHIQTFIEHYMDQNAYPNNSRSGMASYLQGRMNEVNRRLGQPESYRPPSSSSEQRNPIAEHWANRPRQTTEEILQESRTRRKSQSEIALDKIESAKKIPASERLSKMIGEERAKQLTSGEKAIEYDEPTYRVKGKRPPEYAQKTWNEWAATQLRGEKADPSKPGMHVKPQDAYWKDMLEITYRDKDGKPIGVLKTDLGGRGISTLAVDSTLGLRRGKVAFEMLKEAFDRGITEPSGVTSDFTKNLIERVKRLARNDKGEFDMDAFNQIIEELSNMKIPNEEFAAAVMVGPDKERK